MRFLLSSQLQIARATCFISLRDRSSCLRAQCYWNICETTRDTNACFYGSRAASSRTVKSAKAQIFHS